MFDLYMPDARHVYGIRFMSYAMHPAKCLPPWGIHLITNGKDRTALILGPLDAAVTDVDK
jgi:hypothetical protein